MKDISGELHYVINGLSIFEGKTKERRRNKFGKWLRKN